MQTNYNAFAAKVETIASTIVLGIDPSAALDVNMYAGTLFVECGAHTAAKIKTALIEGVECGVRMSKVGHEFAFDFV